MISRGGRYFRWFLATAPGFFFSLLKPHLAIASATPWDFIAHSMGSGADLLFSGRALAVRLRKFLRMKPFAKKILLRTAFQR